MSAWRRRLALYSTALAILVFGYRFRVAVACVWVHKRLPRHQSVAEVVSRHQPTMETKFRPALAEAGMSWPPKSMLLVVFKREARLELWLTDSPDSPSWTFARTYPVLHSSGALGPKLREGDQQVPEGFYELTKLNANSDYHLSVRVDCPSAEDLAHRTVEASELGGDIYVHGNSVSIGCIPVGDRAIEELFTLAAIVDEGRRHIMISPIDPRSGEPMPRAAEPWIADRYARLMKSIISLRPQTRP